MDSAVFFQQLLYDQEPYGVHPLPEENQTMIKGFEIDPQQMFDERNQFARKQIKDWTTKELMHWCCRVMEEDNRDYEEIKMENFRSMTGKQFKKLNKEEMVRLAGSADHGEYLYNQRLPLLKKNKSVKSKDKIRKPGRPPKQQGEIVEVNASCKTGKLWEFLKNLLQNPETCPSLIKWENYDEGTFKFVQSDKVAKLWGSRNRNCKMNYEKFSRAMRYYYKQDVLKPVIGRRLVYKFGPNATGWRCIFENTDNRNYTHHYPTLTV